MSCTQSMRIYRKESMLAFICLFMPGLALDWLREKYIFPDRNLKQRAIEYAIAVLSLNYIVITIWVFFGEAGGSLINNLNQYTIFAWKYLSCAFTLAAAFFFLEAFIRNGVQFSIIKRKSVQFLYWKQAACIYALLAFIMNAIRIFDNNFWEDEVYTIESLEMNTLEMIQYLAQRDSHPPLYYLIFRFICNILGKNGTVFHLVSVIPYMVILILALTAVWKWFGKEAAIILITMVSFMPNAVIYHVEARMYAWAELFVFLSFLGLYGILVKARSKDYLCFTIFSLCAAYTHYYCLIAVAFFYVVLLCEAFVGRDRKKIRKALAVYVCTFLGYLPWAGFLLGVFQRHCGYFWATDILTVKDCMDYIFDIKYGGLLLFVWFFAAIAVILKETGVLVMKYSMTEHSRKKKCSIMLCMGDACLTKKCIWIFAGFISIFGTMAVGIIVSELFRPLFVLRYFYPVLIIAWLILSVSISSMKYKTFYTCVITACILVFALPEYAGRFHADKESFQNLNATLQLTQNSIGKDDTILTNIGALNRSVLEYYYPETAHQMIDTLAMMEDDVQYWLFADQTLAWAIQENVEEADSGFIEIVNNGEIGGHSICIYQIAQKDQAMQILKNLMEKESYCH